MTESSLPTSSTRRLRVSLQELSNLQPDTIYLRDGDVILYRRSRSLLYQCRYKLSDGSWTRRTTGRASLENAITVACDLYDENRYRQRLGLAHRAQSFAQIASICVSDLRRKIDSTTGKTSYQDYVSCIERYFMPYFKEKQLEELTDLDIREFEIWRDRQMRRKPKASTLNNFCSAWNKVIATAVERGFISERVPVPKLTAKGEKGKTRPAFNELEVEQLLTFMETWQYSGVKWVEKEIRPLTRDYVEFLLLTGIRHGTEAMNVRWKDIEWHTDKGVRYLRVWVSGKTGGRWLIAKHRAVEVLKRLHERQRDIKDMDFENLFKTRVPHLLFRYSDGHQPLNRPGTRRHLRASNLRPNRRCHESKAISRRIQDRSGPPDC